MKANRAKQVPGLLEAVNAGRVSVDNGSPAPTRRGSAQTFNTYATFANEREYWENEKQKQRVAAARLRSGVIA